MQGRTLALIILFIGALVSFGLALWSAVQGRLPLVETAHAVLFAVVGLIIVAKGDDSPLAGGCRECGNPFDEGAKFCMRCGCYPKLRSPSGQAA